MRPLPLLLGMALFAAALSPRLTDASPATYDVDPDHTHPAFEADHFGGLSVWRGLFRKTIGTVILDKAAGTGHVDMHVDTSSVETGLDTLNDVLRGPLYFNVAKFPEAHYQGVLDQFVDGAPTHVTGTLTLLGVTRPVDLKINSFKCVPHPLLKREWCGADAYAVINRADFGMDEGKAWGFRMDVTLRIQVEAIVAR